MLGTDRSRGSSCNCHYIDYIKQMGLEDFEKELAAERERSKSDHKRDRSRSRDRDRQHRKHHHRSHHRDREEREEHRSGHRDKRSRRSEQDGHDKEERNRSGHKLKESESTRALPNDDNEEDEWVEKDTAQPEGLSHDRGSDDASASIQAAAPRQRDNWMEAPSALNIDYVQRKRKQSPVSQHVKATEQDYRLRVSDMELNHTLKDLKEGQESEAVTDQPGLQQPAQHEATYTFGDAGASWRMTKLNAIYRQAKESGRKVEDIATERFGDLRAFDDAREEEIELDRRKTYGEGYVGKEKPSGELFQERKLDAGTRRDERVEDDESEDEFESAQGQVMKEKPSLTTTVALDQTALNKLKAQMMKAKLRRAPEAAALEAEYNAAMASASTGKQSGVVVLSKMESRMIDRTSGEVTAIDNKRGRERGLVAENEDMSIEDMVKHERRTRYQAGGEAKAFAERIAKDGKFTVSEPLLFGRRMNYQANLRYTGQPRLPR